MVSHASVQKTLATAAQVQILIAYKLPYIFADLPNLTDLVSLRICDLLVAHLCKLLNTNIANVYSFFGKLAWIHMPDF
jgi:hypothetical protein